jgi:hypothetical protein
MRTIIAGSRTGVGWAQVTAAMNNCGWMPTVVISGRAPGADSWGEAWALWHGVPVEPYPARWVTRGRSAGAQRNRLMARVADALVAVWDGASPGTRDMIQVATSRGLRVFVWQTQIMSWSSPLPPALVAARCQAPPLNAPAR